MKKLAVFGLIVGTVIMAEAADSVTTVNISGIVAEAKDIAVEAPAAVADAALKDGVTDFEVTTITESSNKKAGYTVTLESAGAAGGTAFKLVGAATGEEITYTLKYGGSAATLVGGEALVTDANDKTPKDGVEKTITISIPAGNPAADTYSDTLTLTLTAK